MDEFDLIEQYFKPLAKGYSGSLQLSDDAAIVDVPPGLELIITKDAISEGVHFFGSEEPSLIARKLLRTNLSDLAAKGATPLVYFLALMLPETTKGEWLKHFSEGLRTDQDIYKIHLAGGDTTATRGAMSLSLTAIGTVPKGEMLPRSAARAGDTIYVTGTIGDSALGLGLLQGKIRTALLSDHRHWLEQRYFLPEPKLELGAALRGIAHAAMDISDGLVQDLEHICKASGVGATLYTQQLPLSNAADELIKTDAHLWQHILNGGDDYEILFTAPTSKQSVLATFPVTAIGEITTGNGVTVVDESGKPVTVTRKGYRHFA